MVMTAGDFVSHVKEFKPDFDKYQLAYYRTKMQINVHFGYLTPKLIVYYERALTDLKDYLENKEKGKFGNY